MAYTSAWTPSAPADTDNVSAGAGEIRTFKDDIKDRLQSIIDVSDNGDGVTPGTRDINTDPHLIRPDIIPTVALKGDAAGVGGATRAVTSTHVATMSADFLHSATILDDDALQWELITGMSLTISGGVGNVLHTEIGNTNGATGYDTADYIIMLKVGLLFSTNTLGDPSYRPAFRVRRDPAGTPETIGYGDSTARGGDATYGYIGGSLNSNGSNDTYTKTYLEFTVFDTGRTAAQTYEVECALLNAGTSTGGDVITVYGANSEEAGFIRAIILKR